MITDVTHSTPERQRAHAPRKLIGAVCALAVVAAGVAALTTTHAEATSPTQAIVLNAYGSLEPTGGTPPSTTTWNWRIARGVAMRPAGLSGYTLDGFGGVHPFGGAPTVAGVAYWPGWDIARAIALDPCDNVSASGYVLDGFGGIHSFGGAPALHASAYWPGNDIAKSLVLNPCSGGVVTGYVLDGFGGVHPAWQAGTTPLATPTISAYWAGWNIARSLIVTSRGEGEVLDGYGGLHPFGRAPALASTAYWPGWDIARSLVYSAQLGGGYILDGFGGLHQFGAAPPLHVTRYWAGQDIARQVALIGMVPMPTPTPTPTPTLTQTPTPTSTPAASTVFISTTGSDANPCTQVAPCSTFARGYAIAQPGQIIEVAAGEYGAQTVTGSKASPGVTFRMATSTHVTNLTVHANWVEFQNGVVDGYGWWREAINPVPSHVTFSNITAQSVDMDGGSNISIRGGSVGGTTVASGSPTDFFLEGDVNPLSNVLIDGVDFHDVSHATASDHFEEMRIDAGVTNLTVTRSKFRNISANTSIIFATDTAGFTDAANFTFSDNFFAAPLSGAGGGAYFVFNTQGPAIIRCTDWLFAYNSFVSSPASIQCEKAGVNWVGNMGPKDATCTIGNYFSHNVWQWDTSATVCSNTDRWVSGPQYSASNLGYANPVTGDLHIGASSPGVNAGDPGSFPATDIDGQARPNGAVADAGADEL